MLVSSARRDALEKIHQRVMSSDAHCNRGVGNLLWASLFVIRSFVAKDCSGSKSKQSTKTKSSSSAILASSLRPKRAESALRRRCILRNTKRLTENFGFELISFESGSLVERVSLIRAAIR